MSAVTDPVRFTDRPLESWLQHLREHSVADVLLDREVADPGSVKLPAAGSTGWTEIPPSPVVLGDREAAMIRHYSPDGPKGDWQRLIIAVYRAGGRIGYQEHDGGGVLARITVPGST